MNPANQLITGEFRWVYDDRYRIALPPECVEPLVGDSADGVIAKEREGCLSLWNAELWKKKFEGGVELIRHKLQLDYLERDLMKVQRFSRLLSTRSRPVKLGQRGRLLVPRDFGSFWPSSPTAKFSSGAGICSGDLESARVWNAYLREDIGEFHSLFKELAS
ncbi:MAG: hypothetical protein U1D30_02395 [Planctomycetota bacterium]